MIHLIQVQCNEVNYDVVNWNELICCSDKPCYVCIVYSFWSQFEFKSLMMYNYKLYTLQAMLLCPFMI